jgi:hypothetical protein
MLSKFYHYTKLRDTTLNQYTPKSLVRMTDRAAVDDRMFGILFIINFTKMAQLLAIILRSLYFN